MSVQLDDWVNTGQLLIGGATAVVAMHQTWLWRVERRRSAAPAVAAAAAAMTAVLCLNAALIARLPAAGSDLLLFLRSVGLDALVLSIPPLGGAVSGRRSPRWLVATLAGLVVCRLVLWPTTDLFSTHRLSDGFPQYGPLEAPVALLTVALMLGYLFHVAASQARSPGRIALVTGVVLSFVLGAVSFAVPSARIGELLTGYLTVPCLMSAAGMAVVRERQLLGNSRRLHHQQQTVVELAELAIHESLGTVIARARRSLGQPLTDRLLFGSPDAMQPSLVEPDDEWFVSTLRNVIGLTASRPAPIRDPHDTASTNDPTSALLAAIARVATTQQPAHTTVQLRTVPSDDNMWCECVFVPTRLPQVESSSPATEATAELAAPHLSALSSREQEIVQRLLDGDRVPAIARAMFLSQSTVRTHLSSVFGKLSVTSQQELIELLRSPVAGPL